MTLGNSDKARAGIFERIRKARQGVPQDKQSPEEYLAAHPRGPLKPIPGDVIDHFCSAAQAMQSSVARVASMADVPAAAADYLRSQQLALSGCVTPELAAMDWAAAGLALEGRPARDEDAVGVTGCFAAIAETGTLMLVSGADTPGSVSLLPETHIAVLAADRIVAHMEDGWELLRRELGQPPRAVNFVSGPSRTGDIEQTIVLGAHGPYRVHIIVVG